MPELPEVESVCRNLASLVPAQAVLEGFEFRREDLRFPLPISKLKKLRGQKLSKIERRAKFIFFQLEKGILFSHLGMTGRWRLRTGSEKLGKHDHLILKFRAPSAKNSIELIYSDPRRFGFLDCSPGADYQKHPLLKNLGVEPLSSDFSPEFLAQFFKNKNASVKAALLDQRGVVGVGNIYVCEALFRSGIRPNKKARLVPKAKLPSLVDEIKLVLSSAIQAGGSTIRDYRNSLDQAGGYQDQHMVYGREGDLCAICNSPIKNSRIAGRSSFWCPSCQH